MHGLVFDHVWNYSFDFTRELPQKLEILTKTGPFLDRFLTRFEQKVTALGSPVLRKGPRKGPEKRVQTGENRLK